MFSAPIYQSRGHESKEANHSKETAGSQDSSDPAEEDEHTLTHTLIYSVS